jgi:2-polyprenyl-3-methyl-5-hydroxy-6-metoxy-1,4-benzoquinol methylase
VGLSCNLCGQNSARVLFVKKGFILGRCAHCGLVYVQNPPEREGLHRLYSFQADYHACFRDDDKACAEHTTIAGRHYRLIAKHKTPGRLLDIGCSAGFFLNVARDHQWETYGLEISPDTAAIAEGRHGQKVTVGTLQESTFPPNYFDVVTLWDVLEHVEDPKTILTLINGMLKDDGIVAISTPNIDGLFPKLSYKIAKLINYWPHPEPPHHLFQFSKKTLGRLLSRTGFTLLAVHHERIPMSYTFGTLKELLRSPMRLAYSLIFVPTVVAGPMLRAGDGLIVLAKKSSR